MLQKSTGIPASQSLNLKAWAEELIGLAPDWYTAFQFDMALTWFGTHIENMLNDLDEKGKPRHRLEDLLQPPKKKGKWRALIGKLASMTGDTV